MADCVSLTSLPYQGSRYAKHVTVYSPYSSFSKDLSSHFLQFQGTCNISSHGTTATVHVNVQYSRANRNPWLCGTCIKRTLHDRELPLLDLMYENKSYSGRYWSQICQFCIPIDFGWAKKPRKSKALKWPYSYSWFSPKSTSCEHWWYVVCIIPLLGVQVHMFSLCASSTSQCHTRPSYKQPVVVVFQWGACSSGLCCHEGCGEAAGRQPGNNQPCVPCWPGDRSLCTGGCGQEVGAWWW